MAARMRLSASWAGVVTETVVPEPLPPPPWGFVIEPVDVPVFEFTETPDRKKKHVYPKMHHDCLKQLKLD
jgi:hypothetical protein